MSASLWMLLLAMVYISASVLYVYRLRGRVRYRRFSQYLRKSWPVFAPLNCVLYMTTRPSARTAVISADYLRDIALIRSHWQEIRDEALALHHAGEIEATAIPGSPGYHDAGFRTFYKRGWRKFYLSWYGPAHVSAQRACPRTVQLLAQVPAIRGAMFSILPPGAELTLHADPMACSLRYHLGLQVPGSDDCFINVDGVPLSWRDGQDFVFDETYPHFARNDTGSLRLILMCDVERPMNRLGRAFNALYSVLPRALRVPNTHEDNRGALNALYALVAPWRITALKLKAQRRRLYLLLKYLLNAAILSAAFGLLYLVLQSAERAGQSVLGGLN